MTIFNRGGRTRVAQNAPKVINLQGHQYHSCSLSNCWEKCIETPKKLIARGGNRLRHLERHLPYKYEGRNATILSSSFFTPLIAWKTQTNIRKHICTSQCPTRDPKSTKIELLGQFFSTLKWPWGPSMWPIGRVFRSEWNMPIYGYCLKMDFFTFFSFFTNFIHPMDPETCRNKLAHQNTSQAQGAQH